METGVRRLRFIFNLWIFISLLVFSCKDIPRDNLLDPKNPSGVRPQVIALESFVNTNESIPFDYNFQLLAALNQLENKYRDQIVILEYHRNVQNYLDPFHAIENEALYTKYVDIFDPGSKGVPDVFINGTADRVQGAYDGSGSTRIRLEQSIEPLLIKNSLFAIEPRISKSDADYELSATIARLGKSPAKDILVKAVVISREDEQYLRRVVKLIFKSNVISEIEAGELKEIDFPLFQKEDTHPGSVVFFITSEDESSIFQSIKADLP